MTDTPRTDTGDELPATAWVTVAEAAEKAGVGTSTVRHWYRSGRLPTQRAEGEHGAFMVPLDGVLALARGDEEADALTDEVIDLNASYWSAQTEAAREEATAARHELAEARTELQAALEDADRLRAELAEAADEANRLREQAAATEAELRRERDREPVDTQADDVDESDGLREELREVRDELAGVRDELTEVRSQLEATRADLDATRADLDRRTEELHRKTEELERTAAELDEANTELEQATRDLARAEGQLEVTQRQLARTEAELGKLKEISSAVGSITDNSWLDLPTNSYRSPVRPQGMAAATEAFSGLLAATQPDPVPHAGAHDGGAADEPRAGEGEVAPVELAHDAEAPDDAATSPVRPHHPLGQHDDDLLPQPEKKGRRGRR